MERRTRYERVRMLQQILSTARRRTSPTISKAMEVTSKTMTVISIFSRRCRRSHCISSARSNRSIRSPRYRTASAVAASSRFRMPTASPQASLRTRSHRSITSHRRPSGQRTGLHPSSTYSLFQKVIMRQPARSRSQKYRR